MNLFSSAYADSLLFLCALITSCNVGLSLIVFVVVDDDVCGSVSKLVKTRCLIEVTVESC